MNIINKPSALVEQMKNWAIKNKASKLFIEHADVYMKLGVERDINPVIAYVQYALETNFGNYDKNKTLDKSYCNPSGLRNLVESGKNSFTFKRFKNWEEGIIAHLDHLALVAGVDGYPKVDSPDPRHFNNLFNTCKTVEELQNTWKSDKNYARTILAKVKEINSTEINISDSDINVLKKQVKLLKDLIQEKEVIIIKLEKTLRTVNKMSEELKDKYDVNEYNLELTEKELNDYKKVIKDLKRLMDKN